MFMLLRIVGYPHEFENYRSGFELGTLKTFGEVIVGGMKVVIRDLLKL